MDLILNGWVPAWVLAIVIAALTISLVLGVPLARMAGLRRGKRLAHPEAFQTRTEKAKDTGLFLAALIPTLLVWLAVMGVSFIGLTGFAADVMGWDHWSNVLVPLSLDGISISFGAWAFVAVKRGRHPGRAYKIVLAAATVSAMLNFVHGRDKWSIWAGLYLAFLSFAGMAMFHELLDQFMAGYDDEIALRTRYPRFGLRWFLAPWSTFHAWRTWIVFPPAAKTVPSVRNAIDHRAAYLEDRRRTKLARAALVVEEQQAAVVETLARAEARRAKTDPGSFRSAPAPGGTPVGAGVDQFAHGHDMPGPANGTAAANGQGPRVSGEPAEASSVDLHASRIPAQPDLRRNTLTDSGELTMNARSMSAALDRPTRSMIADALQADEGITSTIVCDWVEKEAARLNQEWRPTPSWARLRIRQVREGLGMPAQDELAEAAR